MKTLHSLKKQKFARRHTPLYEPPTPIDWGDFSTQWSTTVNNFDIFTDQARASLYVLPFREFTIRFDGLVSQEFVDQYRGVPVPGITVIDGL